jgi:hypothetical protein
VLGVGLVVGFLLLLSAGGDGGGTTSGETETANPPGTTAPLTDEGTATTEATTTSAASSGRAPTEVRVLVLNGGGPAGAAASTSETIGSSGYVMGEATNAPITVTATSFFYADEYQEDAIAIASLLGKSTDAVKPLSEEAGLTGVGGDANVIVVLGPDAPPVEGSGTTGTDAGDTTTTAAG